MSFHTSAQEIRVDDGHILRAKLVNENGEAVDAEIDLNSFIGNIDGHFEWNGNNFSASAENVSLSLEGGNNPILRARLRNGSGELADADLNLAERIGNQNGQFAFA